jgi:uncharacterized integral membrane protein (TIGR00697 family)
MKFKKTLAYDVVEIKKNQPDYFVLMAVAYVSVLLLTMLVENRIIVFGSFKILAGTLVLPFAYAISDVIAEVYGYKQMRRLIWISIIALYINACIVGMINHLPGVSANRDNIAYHIVFSFFDKDVFTYSIAALASVFLNAYFLTKWKVLIHGRYFWLRSLGSTLIGEAIFILTWGFLAFSGEFPMHELLELMLTSYVYKIICNIITISPTALLAFFLKKAEGIDVYDYNTNFNPFSWKT